MNEVVETLLKHKYKEKSMRKQAFICRRSKSKRIKDKSFNKLFYAYLEENPVSIIGEIALIDGKYYAELKQIVDDLSRLHKEVTK